MNIIIVYIKTTLSTGNLKVHNLFRTLKFASFIKFIKFLIIFFVKMYSCLIPFAMHDFVLEASVQFYTILDKTYHKFLKNNEKSYKYCYY